MMEEVSAPIKDCAFSRECCDVRIGKNTFKGDLRNYKIHFENERVKCDVTLSGLSEIFPKTASGSRCTSDLMKTYKRKGI